MKLLFDENLSPRLVNALADVYPDSAHVQRVGLGGTLDTEVWSYAREHGYTLVSKDSDFHELSVLRGQPPKIVWIKRGNCSTKQIETILRNRAEQIRLLLNDAEATCLVLQ
jgi:predicted nuclease of predicted toxin-antitoxin system